MESGQKLESISDVINEFWNGLMVSYTNFFNKCTCLKYQNVLHQKISIRPAIPKEIKNIEYIAYVFRTLIRLLFCAFTRADFFLCESGVLLCLERSELYQSLSIVSIVYCSTETGNYTLFW